MRNRWYWPQIYSVASMCTPLQRPHGGQAGEVAAAEMSSDEEVMGEEEAKARRNGMEWVGDAGGLR